jgi:hypothetical protein
MDEDIDNEGFVVLDLEMLSNMITAEIFNRGLIPINYKLEVKSFEDKDGDLELLFKVHEGYLQ